MTKTANKSKDIIKTIHSHKALNCHEQQPAPAKHRFFYKTIFLASILADMFLQRAVIMGKCNYAFYRVRTDSKQLFSRTFQDLQRPNSRVFQDSKNSFSRTFQDKFGSYTLLNKVQKVHISNQLSV